MLFYRDYQYMSSLLGWSETYWSQVRYDKIPKQKKGLSSTRKGTKDVRVEFSGAYIDLTHNTPLFSTMQKRNILCGECWEFLLALNYIFPILVPLYGISYFEHTCIWSFYSNRSRIVSSSKCFILYPWWKSCTRMICKRQAK